MSPDPSLWTHRSSRASAGSLPSASGLRDPGRPHRNIRRRRKAKARPHTPKNGKRARSDSGHSPPRDQTVDAGAHEDELDDEPDPAGDDDRVLDPPEQEPPVSLQMEMLGQDERADASRRETSPSAGLDVDLDSEHSLDPYHELDDPDKLDDYEGSQLDDDAGPEAQPDDVPGGLYDWSPDDIVPRLESLRVSVEFIKGLEGANLDNDPIPNDVRERLRSPPTAFPHIDDDLRMCFRIFLETVNGSQAAYDGVGRFIKQRYPDSQFSTYDQMKRQLTELTGVVPVMTDMCIDTCVAFAGPYSDRRTCPECSAPRFETVLRGNKRVSVPRRQALTIPVGPQIQAQYRSRESAWNMGHRNRVMDPLLAKLTAGGSIDVYDDVYCSSILLDAARRGDLTSDDTILMLSIDGAQLYQSKQSDCWIYIWVLLDLAPDLRYKKKYVLPGGFIPGPKKPKNLDSFVYTGLHHLSALQRDGLRIWDCSTGRVFTSRPFFFLGTADGPGLAALHGQVGHHGVHGCCEYCGLKGRHKPKGPHYYPALLKPMDYDLDECNHADVDVFALPSASRAQYFRNVGLLAACTTDAEFKLTRKDTGLCKPSIFVGLPAAHSSGLPGCLAIDHMHIIAINLPDLLISLWRGTIDCDKKLKDSRDLWDWVVLIGDVWKSHGQDVARCRPYLPGSFDCPPQNPADKINSGYKAWEFLVYIFGYCPALLYNLLPRRYWRNFCQLVSAVRLLQQRTVSAFQLQSAHRSILEFTEEYEAIYYRRMVSRLHFCRQSVHGLSHLAQDVARLGPGVYSSQWTLERTIGNLGQEIKQPSKPYANLANCGLRRSQLSALHAMLPNLSPDSTVLPRGAVDLGDGYILLRARDATCVTLDGQRAIAIRIFLLSELGQDRFPADWEPRYIRWARLRLPNLQIARCAWKEKSRASSADSVRRSRNVKVNQIAWYRHLITLTSLQFTCGGITRIGEVQFYFRSNHTGEERAYALVSLWTLPDLEMLKESFDTVYSCVYTDQTYLRVIDVKTITSVVAMVPMTPRDGDRSAHFFLLEKPGLEITQLGDVTASNSDQ